MWKIFDDRIVHVPGDCNAFEYAPSSFEKWDFDGEIITT